MLGEEAQFLPEGALFGQVSDSEGVRCPAALEEHRQGPDRRKHFLQEEVLGSLKAHLVKQGRVEHLRAIGSSSTKKPQAVFSCIHVLRNACTMVPGRFRRGVQ